MPSLRPSRKPLTLIALVFGLLLCSAPAANAADLFITADGTLHFKADPGRFNDVSFDEDLGFIDPNPTPVADQTTCEFEDPNDPNAFEGVCVTRFSDEDPIDEAPPADEPNLAADQCAEVPSGPAPAPDNRTTGEQQFFCPNVTKVEVDALDKDDIISAAGLKDIPADIDGGTGADQIFGGQADDQISGGDGDDTLYGEDGEDNIDGDAGNDTIFGGSGSDDLDGGAGSDTLYSGDSSGTVTASGVIVQAASSGSDTIEGGAGDDQIFAGDDNDVIDGGDGNDEISGGDGNDTITGGAGDDNLAGDEGDDVIDGGDGNDEISGGAGSDTIRGGSGDDTLAGDEGDDHISGGDGSDTISGNDGNDEIDGGQGDDQIGGGDGNDDIDAGQGEDSVSGGDGNDHIDGGDNNDRMSGGDGNDVVDGGQGEDSIGGGHGDDVIDGGDGNDALAGDDGNDRVFGGEGADSVAGGDGDDVLSGGNGSDEIYGGPGTDVVDYSDADTKVTVDLGSTDLCGGTNACGGAGTDTIFGIENINGSAFDDTLTGNDLNNVINGGAGNDVINGGFGNDTENGEDGNDRFDEGDLLNGSDVFSGGNGIDVVDYHARELQVSVTLDGVANDGQPNEFDNVLPDVENSLRPPPPAFPPPAPAPDLTAPSITGITVNETRISPNGDGVQDTLDIVARFSEPTSWTFEVLSGNNAIFTQIGQGTVARPSWNGLTAAASQAVSGVYTWRITGKDAAGNQLTPKTGTIVVDRRAPRVRSLTTSRRGGVNRIRFTVNEPGTVRARIEGVRKLATIKLEDPGIVTVSWNGRNRRGRLVRPGRYLLVIVVTDPAGNKTVKRLTVRR